MNWNICGHKQQLEFLESAVKRDRLAHALIFAGPVSVGKKTVAWKLAQGMLCESGEACGQCSQCKAFLAGANADFLAIAGMDEIKIEQIRELNYKLSLKPYLAKYKVAVIDDADNLNNAAANALLKVFEEPTPHTIMILITSNPNRLPKTIVSRAQKITFGPVAFQEFERLLPEHLSVEQKRLLASVAAGKPGLALKIVADEAYLQELEQAENYYRIFMGTDLPEKLIMAYDIADLETAQIKTLLETWLLKLQALLQIQADKKLAVKISQVALAGRFLEQNANAKLLLTNMMINT
jgi:DNA polymerase III delta' subunit